MTRFARHASVLLGATLATACGSQAGDVPAADIRSAIAEAVRARGDTLTLTDPRTGAPVLLRFGHVHEGVELTGGGRYTACVDFRDAQGTVYDVDYYVDREDDRFAVEDVVMHKAGEVDVLPPGERARLDSLPG